MDDSTLARFAETAGILPRYHDLAGVEHVTGVETQRALLAALGLPSEGAAVAEALAAWEAAVEARTLPAEIVVTAGLLTTLEPIGGPAAWELELESGEVVAGTGEGTLDLPPLEIGYHWLHRGGERTLIIAAPSACPGVADLTGRRRIWGVTGSLFGLRSDRNHGVGDYEDLARAAEALAGHGADFFGVNPVHALGAETAIFSPYSPSHRGAANVRHIAVDQVPEFPLSEEAQRLYAAAADTLKTLRTDPLIDYAAAHAVAMRVLRALFDTFEETGDETGRAEAFRAFRRERGQAVETFALFEALTQTFGPDLAAWPDAMRRADSDDVRAFADGHAKEVRFHIYLQWLSDMQLCGAQGRARAAGMALGIYADLAVGVRPDGAEPWARPEVYGAGASLGVPPDVFNAEGQMWGLAPVNPLGLSEMAYRPLIDTLRYAFRHAGALRIDHAIGLMRCFWMPDSGLPGAYVRYPMQALMAVIRTEAARAGRIVIGEDLGVVPDGLRDALSESGLYGVAVMQFERVHERRFRDPASYPPRTFASIGTHDTATLAGYWQGVDIDQRVALGQFAPEQAEDEHGERDWDRRRLLWLLAEMDLLPDGMDTDDPPAEMTPALNEALHTALARAGSEMTAVQLDDALGSVEQPNFPGTVDEYPNWRVRCPVPVGALASDQRLAAVARAMRSERGPAEDRLHLKEA